MVSLWLGSSQTEVGKCSACLRSIRSLSSISRRRRTAHLLSGSILLALALLFSCGLAGGASGVKFSARLRSKSSFTSAQASSVKLVCSFPAATKRFSYADHAQEREEVARRQERRTKSRDLHRWRLQASSGQEPVWQARPIKARQLPPEDHGRRQLRRLSPSRSERQASSTPKNSTTPITPTGSAPYRTPRVQLSPARHRARRSRPRTAPGTTRRLLPYQWRRCDSFRDQLLRHRRRNGRLLLAPGRRPRSTFRVVVTAPTPTAPERDLGPDGDRYPQPYRQR